MDRILQNQQIIICPSNRGNEPFYRRHNRGHHYPQIRPGQCGCKFYTKCLLILCASTFLCICVGFIVTMVGHFKKPFYKDDWSDFSQEYRLHTMRNLKNCRVVGPVFLAIGVVLLCASIFYYVFDFRVKRKRNQEQVIREATTRQMGTTSQGGTDTATVSTPANTFGYQQPYGQSLPNPLGPCRNNPPPPSAGSYSSYPVGQIYLPAHHPYPPQDSQGAQQYQTDIPPPPSYESVVNQSKARLS